MVPGPRCEDRGAEAGDRPVIVIIEGRTYRFCGRRCAAGYLGDLDPETGCAMFWEGPQKGGESR